MLKYFYFLLLITFSLQTLATTSKVYVWRNEQGVLVFSDSPQPGAEEVKVDKNINIMPSIDTSILDITPQKIEDKFDLEINQPLNNSTVRDNTGSVSISGLVKPIFKRGLKIQLYLDNIPHDDPQPHAIFILRNVDRGEHQIRMELVNNVGKVIASSKTTTFYMHRSSVK